MTFTVLMATYRGDNPDLLDRALGSVYQNKHKPDAVLLVVDGPIGKSLNSIIEKYENQEGLGVRRMATNSGLAAALNEGLNHIKTEWVVRADSDDYNLPQRFEVQRRYMTADLDLFGAAIQEVDLLGNKLGIRKTPSDASSIATFARYRNPFNHMTVAFRTALALQCGGYPDIHLKEDYALWALMIKNGARVMNIPDVLVEATTGKEMYQRRGGWRYAKAEIALQTHLVSCGLKGNFRAALEGIARSTVFLMPAFLRGWIYTKALRNN